MATGTDERKKETLPQIEKVAEMPKPRRGRVGMDLTPFEELLADREPHAINDVSDRNDREKWARRVRQAAANIGLEAETTYSEEEERLYFRGWPLGEAPARGRRGAATRKNGNGVSTKTAPKKSPAKRTSKS